MDERQTLPPHDFVNDIKVGVMLCLALDLFCFADGVIPYDIQQTTKCWDMVTVNN